MLKDFSVQIDEILSKECGVWRESLQDVMRQIEEQDAILRSDQAQGDRSENAVFQNAVDTKQQLLINKALLEDKILSLERDYKQFSAQHYVPSGVVKIGSCLEFTSSLSTEPRRIKLVGTSAAEPLSGAVSITSPFGSAVLNRCAGDTCKYLTIAGDIIVNIKEVY